MRIACTGLEPGRIANRLMQRGVEFISADVTNKSEFRKAVKACDPDLIIHTAAMTNVDYCEQHTIDAFKVNVHGVENLISWYPGKVVFLSSDHVFDGKKWFGNGYSERHEPSPINIYGVTKLAGESLVRAGVSDAKIIRTSKVFALEDLHLILSMLLDGTGDEIEFTGLIRKSFLYVDHFVDGLLDAVQKFDELPPILNISGTDIYSYAKFWKLICRVWGIDESLIKERRTALKEATPRPFRAGLNTALAKKLGIPLYSALEGIQEVYKRHG